MNKFMRTILVGSIFLSLTLQFSSCKEDEPAPPLSITSINPPKGPVGSTVIIEGVSFSTNPVDNLVSFGNIQATVTAATKTQLTVTVPDGAVDDKISVIVNQVTAQSATNFIVTDRWQPVADFGGHARDITGFAFSVNGKIYYGAGYYSGALLDFWEYDPASDVWTQKQDFEGEARFYATGFGVNSKGYVIGGAQVNGNTIFSNVWQYDPNTNDWTKKNDFAEGARYRAVSFTIGAKGYITTGYNGTAFLKDLWEYDPSTDAWTRKADLPIARFSAFAFTLASKGYVGGGDSGGDTQLYSVYEYNPTLDEWSPKADLPQDVDMRIANSFSSASKGYVTGLAKQLWQFDPVADSWIRKADAPLATGIGFGFSIGDYGYLGSTSSKKVHRYTFD